MRKYDRPVWNDMGAQATSTFLHQAGVPPSERCLGALLSELSRKVMRLLD